MNNRVILGDCRQTMRELIAQGVKAQMCVTSPPYWGLRDYGVAGQLGLEPTLAEFVANMVDVFELVRELLADDGTLWLNLGDSYAGSWGAQGRQGEGAMQGRSIIAARQIAVAARKQSHAGAIRDAGLKPKDLCGVPWRVAFALQEAGWYLRQDIVWHKPNPMPESVGDRCTKAHEYLFLLAKNERYYFDQEAIREPVNGGAHARAPGNRTHKGVAAYDNGDSGHRTKAGLLAYADQFRAPPGVNPKARLPTPSGWDTGAGGHDKLTGRYRNKQNASFAAALTDVVDARNKRSVWTVASEPYSEAHFATYPQKLIEPCILAGSRPGDVVLDPFMGSGTTAQVAQRLGRQWLGMELNPDYLPLAERRTAQAALILES